MLDSIAVSCSSRKKHKRKKMNAATVTDGWAAGTGYAQVEGVLDFVVRASLQSGQTIGSWQLKVDPCLIRAISL